MLTPIPAPFFCSLLHPMSFLSAFASVQRDSNPEKEASHWLDICMYFLHGQRSGSSPPDAFLFNHRSHINAGDEEKREGHLT